MALGVVFALSASGAFGRTSAAATACGHERWPVKTLQDPLASSVNFTPRATTVDHLRRLKPPDLGRNAPRQRGLERRTYRVNAQLVGFKLEADSDIHLVIADPSNRAHTMIVELPDPGCTPRASASARTRMRRARTRIVAACGRPTRAFRTVTGSAKVTGVGFWDFKHRQTGVAPNAIELHPVTAFSSSNCR